jgi:hypothetical protein
MHVSYVIDEVERVAKKVRRTRVLDSDEMLSLQNHLSLIQRSHELQIHFTREQIQRINKVLKIFPDYFSLSETDTENTDFFRTIIQNLMSARENIAKLS